MRYSEALKIVHELATQNQIDENDVAFGDERMGAQRAWQQEALDTLGSIVTNHADEIDSRFEFATLVDVDWKAVQADREADATSLQASIRICLDLADWLDLMTPDMQEEVDRQKLAFKTVENFIVTHGDALDASMTTLKM